MRVKAGAARSYYIGLETSMPAIPGYKPPLKALCVVPQGMQEGAELLIEGREFGLVTGGTAAGQCNNESLIRRSRARQRVLFQMTAGGDEQIPLRAGKPAVRPGKPRLQEMGYGKVDIVAAEQRMLAHRDTPDVRVRRLLIGALDEHSAPKEYLATRIAAALQPCLRLAEIESAQRKPDIDLGPHDLALRAMPHVLSLDADGNARATDFLERAMNRDPDHALATALAAWAYGQRVVYHFTATPAEDIARSAELARKATALAGDATALAVLGNALTLLHDLDAAGRVIREALAVDGGSA
jgi:hypothetical protein